MDATNVLHLAQCVQSFRDFDLLELHGGHLSAGPGTTPVRLHHGGRQPWRDGRVMDNHCFGCKVGFAQYDDRGQLLDLRAGNLTTFGEVRTVVAVGEEHTHQFELRLDLEGNRFPVGQTLRVWIPTADSRKVLTVPRDALVLRPDGQSIFIVDADNQARQIRVTVGVGQGEHIEVRGAVSPGDRVIIRGNERLRPGQAVNIMDS